MSIHPTTWRLRNEGLVLTAKAGIAPIAISASPVAVLMVPLLPPQGDSLHSAGGFVSSCKGESAQRRPDTMGRPRSEPAPARFRAGIDAARDRPVRRRRAPSSPDDYWLGCGSSHEALGFPAP